MTNTSVELILEVECTVVRFLGATPLLKASDKESQPHLQSPATDDVNRVDWLYLRSTLIKWT